MKNQTKGLAELKRALQSITGELAPIVHRSAVECAEIIAAEIRANAPVDSGRTRDSVEVVERADSRGHVDVSVEVGGGTEDGTSREHIVRFIEFGTAFKSPNPFIRRSFDSKADLIARKMTRDIDAGLGKITGK